MNSEERAARIAERETTAFNRYRQAEEESQRLQDQEREEAARLSAVWHSSVIPMVRSAAEWLVSRMPPGAVSATATASSGSDLALVTLTSPYRNGSVTISFWREDANVGANLHIPRSRGVLPPFRQSVAQLGLVDALVPEAVRQQLLTALELSEAELAD